MPAITDGDRRGRPPTASRGDAVGAVARRAADERRRDCRLDRLRARASTALDWSNTVQILFKYWSNTVQTLFKHCSNAGQILVKCWSNNGASTTRESAVRRR
jgi:hypothetical protein